MHIARQESTANLKLTDNLIVSPDTSTVYGELCWLTWLQNQEASGLSDDWLCGVSARIISAERRYAKFNSYIQIWGCQ